jgi:hypothetical protein
MLAAMTFATFLKTTTSYLAPRPKFYFYAMLTSLAGYLLLEVTPKQKILTCVNSTLRSARRSGRLDAATGALKRFQILYLYLLLSIHQLKDGVSNQ